jgi:hypothetical protein
MRFFGEKGMEKRPYGRNDLSPRLPLIATGEIPLNKLDMRKPPL